MLVFQRAGFFTINTSDGSLVCCSQWFHLRTFFTSQPFVIAYGKEAPALLDKGIVAHERTGVAGRRLVAYSLGYVRAVDEATFGSLLQGP